VKGPCFDEITKFSNVYVPQNTMPPYAPDNDLHTCKETAYFFAVDDDPPHEHLHSQKTRKRTATFDLSQNQIETIPHYTCFDSTELSNLYYNREEYLDIRRSAKAIVLLMDLGWPVKENDEVTTRGLEFFTRKSSQRKNAVRLLTRTVVQAQTK
jgi:hypothetical protein